MSDAIIKLEGVNYQYPSGTSALRNVSLTIPCRKKTVLLGGNGAGKSTLILLLNGVLKPSSGYLSFKNKKISYKKSALQELRSNIGLLFHDPDYQLIAPSVYEELSFGLMNKIKDKALVRKKIEAAIEDFCLFELRDKAPHQLSAGQKKRVCLASILVMKPELIVCDEPASSLDPKHTSLIFNYLNNLHAQQKSILISTHDVNQAYTWSEHVIILKHGEVLATGNPKEIFSDKALMEEANLDQPFIIEACQSLNPEINPVDLPKNLLEFKEQLKTTPCTDF